jgi:hypothetical protein
MITLDIVVNRMAFSGLSALAGKDFEQFGVLVLFSHCFLQ